MLKTGGTNFSGKLLSANLPEKAVKYPILFCLFFTTKTPNIFPMASALSLAFNPKLCEKSV